MEKSIAYSNVKWTFWSYAGIFVVDESL